MKSHYVLMQELLQELGKWCSTSTTHDFETIMRRVEHEGLEFLTITLPTYSKDLERALDQGGVDSSLFLSFKKRNGLPVFLQGFLSQVFNITTGALLDEPNVHAIQAIRQICNLMGKLELPCSDARVRRAFTQYIETDNELRALEASLSPQLVEEFGEVASALWTDIFVKMEKTIYDGDIVPRHGPGATADRISGNAKFRQQVWTQRLEELFPHGEFVFPNWRHFDAERVELLAPGAEMPVRVITVPKTQKTPRIIAIEPACVQYVQQGLMERLVDLIGRHNYLSVIVGFKDQERNQELARIGSINGSLATLDLSEASDRVSWQLVQKLVEGRPWLSQALDSTRSKQAAVPGHGIHSLAKYASMGSALCFPVEAMVFTTIIFMGIRRTLKVPRVTPSLIKRMVGQVRVYGDDIIVPVEFVPCVTELLETFGLRVNSHKSFWTGKFRESCGKEYFDGHDVSYIKLRHLLPSSRKHATEICSIVSFRNQLFKAGYVDTVEWLDNFIERLIPFPEVAESSRALGRHGYGPYRGQKTCPYLQRPLVKAYYRNDVLPPSPLGEDSALLKYFLKRDNFLPFRLGVEPLDRDHLKRAGRPSVPTLRLGWVAVY